MKRIETIGELRLPPGKFWFLGSPYTLYHAGTEVAYEYIKDISASLYEDGIAHYCPVVPSHEWSIISGLDPLDLQVWLPINQPWMDLAHGLCVVRMRGWADSVGLKQEIEWFESTGRPVVSFSPDMIMPEEV